MRLLPVLVFLIASVAECLMLSRVLVPQYKLFGEDALLKCDYSLGRDRLYAVKWYKDNEEFFRYVPRFNPPIYTHHVEGVTVDNMRSNDKRVLLRGLTVRSTGLYRCEVSAEAPSFASYMGEGRMTVVYLPKEAPQITGLSSRDEYQVGSVLDLNCTSAKSFPPAKLSWYINDSPIPVPWSVSIHPAISLVTPVHTLNPPYPTTPTPYTGHHGNGHGHNHNHHHHPHFIPTPTSPTLLSSLLVSTLRLKLKLEGHHFGPKGTAKVRCVARISPLFWQDGDEKILGGENGHEQHQGSNHHRHQQGRKKVNLEYSGEGEEEEGVGLGEGVVTGAGEDKPEMEESFNKNYNHHNSHHGGYNGQNGYGRGVEEGDDGVGGDDEEEGEDGDGGDDEYYGLGSPAFQREALVLVRGGCSSLHLSRRSTSLINLFNVAILISFKSFSHFILSNF